jgi:hypothetical protein
MEQNDSAIVFTTEWLQTAKQRNESLPAFASTEWPYQIATNEAFSVMREQIENWVADLPVTSRRNAVERLRSDEAFFETYHELVVGHFLRSKGMRTEYERDFDGQTPDWFVSRDADPQGFIVEVFTANISDVENQANNQLDEFTRRIQALPYDVGLHLAFNDGFDASKLQPSRNKRIIKQLEGWLANPAAKTGSQLCLDAFTFTVAGRDMGFSSVQPGGFAKATFVNTIPLREKIERKIHKYKHLVESRRLPLIIAVIPDFDSHYGPIEMRRILFGQAFEETVLSNGLFAKSPLLSGAILGEVGAVGSWKMHHFLNPLATNPLPNGILCQN